MGKLRRRKNRQLGVPAGVQQVKNLRWVTNVACLKNVLWSLLSQLLVRGCY